MRGTTRLFNCREESSIEPQCINFQEFKEGTEFSQPVTIDQVTFRSLGGPLRAATFGDPIGHIKLAFPAAGVRIEFAQPVEDVKITVNNYAGPTLEFAAFSGATLVAQFSEPINNGVKNVAISQTEVTAVEISGGGNEAAVVEVCFTRVERR